MLIPIVMDLCSTMSNISTTGTLEGKKNQVFYKFPFNKANLNLGFMLHVGTMQSETWAEIHANCLTPAPRHCLFFIVKYAQAQHQWAQRKAAPAVRPADIRGLVIRIGTYTHTQSLTHTRYKRPSVCMHTRTRRCVCTIHICTNKRTQTQAHKRWKWAYKKQDIGSSCEKWSRGDINNSAALTSQEAAAS